MADLVSMLTAIRIEPMAREDRKNIYTEHRTVEASEPRTAESEPTSTPTEPVIEIGDRVVVSYDDPPGEQAVLVVAANAHDPAMGIFRSSSPTGKSLLGKTVDEEVTISVGDQSRSATILAIDKKKPAKVNADTAVVREPTVAQPDPLSERGTRTTSPPLRTPGHPEPEMPRTPNQTRRSVEPGRAPSNRVIEELLALDERFENPQCSRCGGKSQLTINNEGLVVFCTSGCKKVERVDVQTLQRLAERLGVTCYQCKGTKLESQSGKFSNYLKCRDDGANNSWQRISERIGT